MSWMTTDFHYQVTVGVIVFSIFMMVILSLIDAPYGRHGEDRHWLWGPSVSLKLSWFIMEFPVFFTFLVFFFVGDHWFSPAAICLFLLFESHYFHRTFIYPRTIKPKPGAGFRISLLVLGVPLNTANAFINGAYISQFGAHLQEVSWLWDPRFIIGVAVFLFGLKMGKQSDAILASLRKPGETGYKIPYGGFYKWVSNPHYLGELVQWSGFAIACWSLPGLAFAFLTLANLLPRALSNHRWNKQRFPDYPPERKALIPYVI